MKKNYYTYLFAFGHFCSDINQTALSALLPFLIATYHFDYTTAALLVMVSNIIGSLVQPLLGQLADKKNCPWIMALGLFLAGEGMAVPGLIPTFAGLCVAVMISGVGIAILGIKGTLLFFIPEILVCLLIARFYNKLVDIGEEKISNSIESTYDTIKKDSWVAFTMDLVPCVRCLEESLRINMVIDL